MKETILKLEELGLTEKEARVYIDLLGRTQPVGTSKIVYATKLHGQFVYTALEKLERHGLVKHSIQGSRKKFSANPLTSLLQLIETKRYIYEQVAAELRTITRGSLHQQFEVFEGSNALVTHELAEIGNAQPNEEWCIIAGTGSRFNELFGEQLFNEYEAKRTKKRIRVRYIGAASQHDELAAIKAANEYFDFHCLEGFESNVINTCIRPGSVTISTYSAPPLAYDVQNEEIAEGYRNFFEALWALTQK